MKVMSFSSGGSTRRIYGWVSIIWFTSAVSVTVSEEVELLALSEVAARCGDNVTLTCDATLPDKSVIKHFAWEAGNKTCQIDNDIHDSEFLCESRVNTHTHQLTLTLLNVMPVDERRYLCKLRTVQGTKSATTFVKVHECFGSVITSINWTHAESRFNGVYPSGIIHWFQGGVNLTDSTSTDEVKGHDGRYDVWSTLDVQKGDLNQPYTCKLWIPSEGRYFQSLDLYSKKPQESSGNIVKLQWICIMVEFMMVKFMS
ncbi:uncharacterized protein LOC115575016 isoform X2 [Sparus aurata]|nr:uncharacterized protein LOC115575016 isoform X2 [Sparus aurata]